MAEAARGMVDSFAVVAGRPPCARAERHMTARSDEDLLTAVIDEVIHWLDAYGEIPLSVVVRPALDGGVVLFLVLARGQCRDLRCGAEGSVTAPPALCAGPGGPVVMRDHGRRIAPRAG
jgi:hypothetical protein